MRTGKRQTSRRFKNVDAVIAVMGQPEDYIIEDELKELHPITLLQTLEQKIIPR
jgi:hypothetical protein